MSADPASSRISGIINKPENHNHPASLAVLLFCLLLNALFLKFAFTRIFIFEDYDGYLSMAWRILQGQKIYTDFLYHSGPVFPHTMAFFLMIFGLNKWAVLAELLCSSSLAVCLTYVIARAKLPFLLTAFATLLTTITFHWDYPFPGYTQDSIVWALFALCFLATRGAGTASRSPFLTGFACSFFAALSFLAKENVGAGFIALFFFYLLLAENSAGTWKGFAAGLATAGALLVILVPRPWTYLEQGLISTAHASFRFQRFLEFKNYSNLYWLMPAMTLLNLPGKSRKQLGSFLLVLGTCAVAIFSTMTGSQFNIPNHIPFWGIGFTLTAVFFENIRNESSGRRKFLRRVSMTVIILAGLFKAGSSLSANFNTLSGTPPGIRLIQPVYRGPWSYDFDYKINVKGFEGWYCERMYAEALNYFVPYVKQNVPAGDRLLVYGNMQLLYGLTGRKPLYRTPFKFYLPDAPAKGPQSAALAEQIQANPPDWALLYAGNVLTSPFKKLDEQLGLGNFWEEKYAPVYMSAAWLLVRKKS